MNSKILLISAAMASGVVAFSYIALNRTSSESQQAFTPDDNTIERWSPLSQGSPADAESQQDQSASVDPDTHDKAVIDFNDSSMPPEMIDQNILSGLTDELKAQYIQAQEASWQKQLDAARKMQDMEQTGLTEKIPEEQARILSVAMTQIPGIGANTEAADTTAWQPAEEDFPLPDDEQFYTAEVEHTCADSMCKLQFQGFDGTESRDSAIDKLIEDKKIPQGAMIVPDESNPGRFVVIYPQKQS